MQKKLWLLSAILISGAASAAEKEPWEQGARNYVFYRPLRNGFTRVWCVSVENAAHYQVPYEQPYGTYDGNNDTVLIQWESRDGMGPWDLNAGVFEHARNVLAKTIVFTVGITATTVAAVALINKIYKKEISKKKAAAIACGGTLLAMAAYYATFGPYIMFSR